MIMKEIEITKAVKRDTTFITEMLNLGAEMERTKDGQEMVDISDRAIVALLEYKSSLDILQWHTFKEKQPDEGRLVMVEVYDEIKVLLVFGEDLVTIDEYIQVVYDIHHTPMSSFGTDLSNNKWAYVPQKVK
jgi:hypothetical protein